MVSPVGMMSNSRIQASYVVAPARVVNVGSPANAILVFARVASVPTAEATLPVDKIIPVGIPQGVPVVPIIVPAATVNIPFERLLQVSTGLEMVTPGPPSAADNAAAVELGVTVICAKPLMPDIHSNNETQIGNLTFFKKCIYKKYLQMYYK